MAACSVASRGLFGEVVQAVLGSWPVLQIAVENGFGGAHSQEKAEWMVGAVDQYFQSNSDLELYEVEDTLLGMMNDEFDTLVEDGSQSLVAQQLCTLFSQCRRGETAAVREKIAQLCQKKYNVKTNVREEKANDDEGDESSEDEAMDCETTAGISHPAPSASAGISHPAPSASVPAVAPSDSKDKEEQEVDEWTVVRRKKK